MPKPISTIVLFASVLIVVGLVFSGASPLASEEQPFLHCAGRSVPDRILSQEEFRTTYGFDAPGSPDKPFFEMKIVEEVCFDSIDELEQNSAGPSLDEQFSDRH